MKKVFLYAYDGTNLGDDLFVRLICRRYPRTRFYIWGGSARRAVFRDVPNLRVLDRARGINAALETIRPSFAARYRNWLEGRCDAVVYIGGSVFMEYPTWSQSLEWWDYQAEHRPFYVLGANFGPYETEAYRAGMAGIFPKMKDVCFRDRYSQALFGGNARYAPDLLLGWPMPEVPLIKKQLFVSVIDCETKEESGETLGTCAPGYLSHMAELLTDYLGRGWHLVLASFCRQEGDAQGIARLLDAIGIDPADSRIKVLSYDGTNTAQILETIAGAEAVIASRFHAAILALAAGRPVLPIAYSHKTLRVLEDLGFDGTVVDLRDGATWAGIRDWKPNTPIPAHVRAAAAEHFEKLDTIF